MLRQELQSYFDRVYPYSVIDTEHTIGGQVHIRFELGGEVFKNGTIERVNQATDRAIILFNDTFDNPENTIWVLIYDYSASNAKNNYLYKQFPVEEFKTFYNQLEQVNTRMLVPITEDKEIFETTDARIIIGKVSVKQINAENIIRGIVNNEMGFKPAINQAVHFIDPLTDKSFHIYDDRGCYIWSDKADKIRDIYIKRNDWIVDYHRPEIDKYFKPEE